MTTGFHTAATGMIWTQKSLGVTANNVANVSTQGYKADKASFADLLYTEVRGQPNQSPDLKVGHGSKLGKTDTMFATASLDETGQPQDYALPVARNFFAVRTDDGRTAYPRSGRFALSRHADGRFYLVDGAGENVLDANGQPIIVTDEKKAQNVGVFTFRNLDGLKKTGGNNYTPTDRSGPASVAAGAQVRQGYIESSAVDMATEISNMVIQQRTYDLDARMVTMTDEVMQTVNSLR